MKYYHRVKIMLFGQLVGMLLINTIFAVQRFNTMGFYEALGRSVFSTFLGFVLLAVGFILAAGVLALMDKDNRE